MRHHESFYRHQSRFSENRNNEERSLGVIGSLVPSLFLPSVPQRSEFISFAAADEMRRWYGHALDLWLARTETRSRLVLERSPGGSPRRHLHRFAGPDASKEMVRFFLEEQPVLAALDD